jgi:hypothetical protein
MNGNDEEEVVIVYFEVPFLIVVAVIKLQASAMKCNAVHVM